MENIRVSDEELLVAWGYQICIRLHGWMRSLPMLQELNMLLGIQTKLSTAYPSQTDGQTEWMNQEIEQYL